MRLHIALDDELVAELDRRAGPGQRGAFIAQLVRRALDDERRWDDIEAALGGISDTGHDWDDDPAEWVRRQRHSQRQIPSSERPGLEVLRVDDAGAAAGGPDDE